MRRREFFTLLGCAAGWPMGALAQQAQPMRRLGILMPLAENDDQGQKYVTALVQALHELGWQGGSNIRIDYRWAGPDAGRIQGAATEILILKPDAILAMSPLTVAPLQQMTATVPIVFVQVTDPVGGGLVASLARPGGNITGFAASEFAIGGKLLEVLKQVAPAVNAVAVLYNPAQLPQVGVFKAIESAAPSFGIKVSAASVRDAGEISHVIDHFANGAGAGMVVLPNPITIANRGQIIALLAKHGLPGVYVLPIFVQEGGLVSYGVDNVAQYRQAASYIDRILKGAKPADLPVQLPNKFIAVAKTQPNWLHWLRMSF
jgi:putative ABC transport system substrate-binding protein